MNKKNNNKGFTLAELLIVVAIIAVLVAIAIPVFNSQLEKSREATDGANIRSEYAQVMTEILTDEGTGFDYGKNAAGNNAHDVTLKQLVQGWQNSDMWKGLASLSQDSVVADGTMGVSINDTVKDNVSQGAKVQFSYKAPANGDPGVLTISCKN